MYVILFRIDYLTVFFEEHLNQITILFLTQVVNKIIATLISNTGKILKL